jgi:hypothetical protein
MNQTGDYMKLLILTIALFGFLGVSSAEETMTEKTEVAAKTIKRNAKKGLHRTKEAFCGKLTGENKVQCLAKEAKNRLEEGKDVIKDKASEVKNDIDSDKK